MLLVKLMLKAALTDTPYWIIQQMAKTEFKRREVEKSLSGQRYVNMLGSEGIRQWLIN